jgi:uncharacterized protein (DUF1499 family)
MADTSLIESLDRRAVDREASRHTRKARFSRQLGAVAIPVIIIAVLMHRGGVLNSTTMLAAIALAVVLATIGIILAVAAVATVGRYGLRGLSSAGLGMLYGMVVLALPIWGAIIYFEKPTINDVTTSPLDPPAFVELAEAGGQPAKPYNREFGPIQRIAYPSVVPLRAAFSPETVFDIVTEIVEQRGWRIVEEIAPSNGIQGRLEAVATTMIVGFQDDVVIVIDYEGAQSKITMRSRSRVGKHDFGTNAKRIDTFLSDLATRLTALPID